MPAVSCSLSVSGAAQLSTQFTREGMGAGAILSSLYDVFLVVQMRSQDKWLDGK